MDNDHVYLLRSVNKFLVDLALLGPLTHEHTQGAYWILRQAVQEKLEDEAEEDWP